MDESRFGALKGDDMGPGAGMGSRPGPREPYRPMRPAPVAASFDATKSAAAAAEAAGAEDKVKGSAGEAVGTLAAQMEESEAKVRRAVACLHVPADAPMRGAWFSGLPISRAAAPHRLDRTGQYLRAWRPLSPGHSP